MGAGAAREDAAVHRIPQVPIQVIAGNCNMHGSPPDRSTDPRTAMPYTQDPNSTIPTANCNMQNSPPDFPADLRTAISYTQTRLDNKETTTYPNLPPTGDSIPQQKEDNILWIAFQNIHGAQHVGDYGPLQNLTLSANGTLMLWVCLKQIAHGRPTRNKCTITL